MMVYPYELAGTQGMDLYRLVSYFFLQLLLLSESEEKVFTQVL